MKDVGSSPKRGAAASRANTAWGATAAAVAKKAGRE